jgi:hypothetical protein
MPPIRFRRSPDDPPNVVTAMSVAPIEVLARSVSPQAADAVAQQRRMAGSLLAELYGYLSAQVAAHPDLAPAIPAMSNAVAEYRAGTAADPFSGIRAVYAVITQARRSDPSIPEP